MRITLRLRCERRAVFAATAATGRRLGGRPAFRCTRRRPAMPPDQPRCANRPGAAGSLGPPSLDCRRRRARTDIRPSRLPTHRTCECRIRGLARRWPAPRRGCRADARPSASARRTPPSGRTVPSPASGCQRRWCRRLRLAPRRLRTGAAASRSTFASATSPSYGHSNATAMQPCAVSPSRRACCSTSRHMASAWSRPMLMLRTFMVSVAARTTATLRTPVARARFVALAIRHQRAELGAVEIETRHHLVGAGHFRHCARAREARHFHGPQAGVHQGVDQPHAVGAGARKSVRSAGRRAGQHR